eukprot:433103_1
MAANKTKTNWECVTTTYWECDICTYDNTTSNTLCEMCGARKPKNKLLPCNNNNDDQKINEDKLSRCKVCTFKSNLPRCPMCDNYKKTSTRTKHKYHSYNTNKKTVIRSEKPSYKYCNNHMKDNKLINHTNNMNNNALTFKIYDIVLYKDNYAEIMCINNDNNTIGITYPITEYIIMRHKATVLPYQIVKTTSVASDFSFGCVWKWDNNGIWKEYDTITSKQIDNEIAKRWYNSHDCHICFLLTKGSYFNQKQNKGIYICHIQLNQARNKMISCIQQNMKTQFKRKILLMRRFIGDGDDIKTENKEAENDDTFIANMTYKQAKCLQFLNKIDIRLSNGLSYTATICDIEMKDNDEKMYKILSKSALKRTQHKYIKIHMDEFDLKWMYFGSKYTKWIDIDKIFKHKLYKLQKYKSISNRTSHRLKHIQIGDSIDINPIHIDPGWKPAQIKQIYKGQIQVKFTHSVSKRNRLYWLHLDNEVECEEFKKGKMDIIHVKALFYATILPHAFTIIEVKNIANKDSVNVYESLLKVKCKNGRQKWDIEKYLWHGTGSIHTLKLIMKNGFDRSYNKVGKFGKGTYFAKDACYSVKNGYCGKDKNNNYFILLCRVIVGQYTIGKSDMKQIPKKLDGTEYDSLVNNLYDPNIFVSWRDFM